MLVLRSFRCKCLLFLCFSHTLVLHTPIFLHSISCRRAYFQNVKQNTIAVWVRILWNWKRDIKTHLQKPNVKTCCVKYLGFLRGNYHGNWFSGHLWYIYEITLGKHWKDLLEQMRLCWKRESRRVMTVSTKPTWYQIYLCAQWLWDESLHGFWGSWPTIQRKRTGLCCK